MKLRHIFNCRPLLAALVVLATACSLKMAAGRALTSIAVTPSDASIADGTSTAFLATGTFSDGSTADLTSSLTWNSSEASIATVNQGSVTGVSVGSTIITAADIAHGVSGSARLSVTAAVLTSVQLTPTNPSIALGTTQAFAATGIWSDLSTTDLTSAVTFHAADAGLVAFAGATARGLAVGATTITAVVAGSGITGTTTLTVTAATLTSIAVTPTNPSIALGTSATFTAVGTFSDNSTQDLTASLDWSSSNSAFATVSNTPPTRGLATSVAVGSATITATDQISGTRGTTTITVTPARLVSLAVTPTNPSIARGTSQPMAAVGTFTDDTTQDLTSAVTWSSSAPSVATVANGSGSSGVVASVSPGSTTIGALHVASGITATSTITVTNAALVSIAVTPADPSIALGTTVPFTATGTYTDHSTQDLTGTVTWTSGNATVAVVSNAAPNRGLATSRATGAATITATDPGSGLNGSTMLVVTPAALLSIAVTPASPSFALGTSAALTATGTFSDASTQNLTTAVTWSSSNAAVATVSNASGNNGRLVTVSTGTITVTATHPASGVVGSTTATVSPAALVSIAISPSHPSIALGLSQALTATGTFSDGTTQDLTTSVTWSSSNSGVATVSNAPGSRGLSTSVSVGSATVTALRPSSGISGATTITITPAVPAFLEIAPDAPTLYTSNSLQFTATLVYSDGSTQDLTNSVAWSSSDTNVADVSSGLANGLANGTTTLTAVDPGTGFSDSTTLTVAPPPVLVSLSLSPSDPTIAHGLSLQFAAIGLYSDGSTQDLAGSVAWTSSDTNIADVSAGSVNGLWVGVVTITADESGSGLSASTSLTVAPALTGLGISPTDPTITQGSGIQFTATGNYSDGSTQDLTGSVNWSSSDTNVAAVSSGYATSYNTGTATISIDDPGSGTSASTTLFVDPPPSLVSISLSPTDPTITQGNGIQFTATGNYSDGSTQDLTGSVNWSSSDTNVGDVSNGYATSYNTGSTTISFYDPGSGTSASTTLFVDPPPSLVSISLSPTDPTITQGTDIQFTATGNYSDGSTQDLTSSVSWSSSDTNVADVSSGYATSYNAGSTTISFYDPGSGTSASTTLFVDPPPPPPSLVSISLSPTDPTITQGTDIQFTATGNYSDGSTQDLTGSVNWSSSDTNVADVNTGYATSHNAGSTTITATDSGSGINASTTLFVDPPPPSLVSLSLSPTDPTITQGTDIQFTATGNYSDGSTQDLTGSVNWSSSDTNVADVNTGYATSHNAGSTTITATDSGSGIGASTSLTVQ